VILPFKTLVMNLLTLSATFGALAFLLARIKEARDGGMPSTAAVAHGPERTGRIVSAAALLMCVALGTLTISKIEYIKELGFGLAFAVAVDAFLVRPLLVPALMELLGRWNWWAPAPGRSAAHRRDTRRDEARRKIRFTTLRAMEP